MKILRTYILKELCGPFLISLVIFTFVMLMGNMIKLAEMVINKGVSVISVAKLLVLLLPYLLCYTLPMAILTGVLLTFGRFSSDNEITGMKASGVSLTQIFIPPVVLGLLFSLLSIPLNDQVLPLAHFASRKTVYEIGMKNPTSLLEPGKFIKSFKDYIIFLYGIEKDTKRLKHIRIYQNQPGRPTRTIIAQSGEFEPRPEQGKIILKLHDVITDEPDPQDPTNPRTGNVKEWKIPLSLEENPRLEDIQKKTNEMTISQLRTEIEKFKKAHLDLKPIILEITEIHKKISLSFSCLAFILIGLPLAVTTRRAEKSIGFGLSLGLIVIYYLLLAGGKALAIRAVLPPGLAMWLPNILLGGLGIGLMIKVARD